MAVDPNMIQVGDFAEVQSIDFVNRFEGSLKGLMEALGVTRKIPKSVGSAIRTFKSTVTLESGAVPPGELIPLSKVETEVDKTYVLGLSKWRKAITAEAIQDQGFTNAVSTTDDKLLKEIQRGIRSDFFNFLGTGTGVAGGIGLQAALAQGWGATQTLFEDESVETIAFANQADIADYVGNASLTVQTMFGMNFVTGFTGIKAVIVSSKVPKGYIYATVPDNIVLAYAEVSGELDKAFTLTKDETGYIGVTHYPTGSNASFETLAMSAMLLFAERLDGVVKVEIQSGLSPVGP